MSRASPVPFDADPMDAPPVINVIDPLPGEVHYSRTSLDRSRTSLDRSRTSLNRSMGSMQMLTSTSGFNDGEKSEKKEKEGGLSKFKAKFFKKKGKKEVPRPPSIEEPAYASVPRTPTSPTFPAPPHFQAPFEAGPAMSPAAFTRPGPTGDVLILKEAPPRSACRAGRVLDVLLVLGLILGIVLCICIVAESSLIHLGPILLGMSAFALCGKAFFTLFWEEDPLPALQPYVRQAEGYLGASKDPYGLHPPPASAAYVGPMEMTTLAYPRLAPATHMTEPAPPYTSTYSQPYPAAYTPPQPASGASTPIRMY